MLGDLLQGALWLALVGLVAVIVVIALIVAAVRRATGKTQPPVRRDEAGKYREDDYRQIAGTTAPRSDELGRYEGGDVRTVTETTTTTGDGRTIVRTDDLDDRAAP